MASTEDMQLVAIHVRSTTTDGIHSYFRFTPETAPIGLRPLLDSLRRARRTVVVFPEYRPLQ